MNKIVGSLAVVLGLACLSLLFSANPILVFGSASIGFGLGFLICG
jgi:hypothetical protein